MGDTLEHLFRLVVLTIPFTVLARHTTEHLTLVRITGLSMERMPMDPKQKHSILFNRQLIPVSFRYSDLGSGAPEHTTQAVSFSQNGFVIISPERLKIGSLLSLRLRVPPEVSGGPFWESHCADARVVTEQLLKGGELGYRVTINDDALRP